MSRGKHVKRRQVGRRTLRITVAASAASLLTATAVQLPAAPVQAEVATSGLARFLDPNGRSHYANEIASLVDAAAAQGTRIVPEDVNVYAVPTVEGVTRFVTANPNNFVVTQNIARTMIVPGHDPSDYLGVGTVISSGNAHLIVHVAPEETRRLLNEAGDPEYLAAEVFDVVPLANASLPVADGPPQAYPQYQYVDSMASSSVAVGVGVSRDTNTDVVSGGSTVTGGSTTVDGVNGGSSATDQVDQLMTDDDGTDAEWRRNTNDCFRVDNNAWWRQVCWHIDNQVYDDSSNVTYWQFHMDGSSYPKQKRGMYHTWVEGKPNVGGSNGAQEFDGRQPVPNAEVGGADNCADQTQGLSLSGGKPIQVGLSYSYSYKTCETFTPKGYSDEGHWSNKWHFNPDRNSHGIGYGSSDTHMRNVGFNMTLKTAGDKGVSWSLYTGTEVTKKYCC